jgi:hypothetical protein
LPSGPNFTRQPSWDGRGRQIVQEHALVARAGASQRQPGQPVDRPARARRGVADVQVARAGEVRIEGQAHQPRLAHVAHGQVRNGLGGQPALRGHADAAGPLGQEEPPVGRESERPGDLQTAQDRIYS